jgi:hypothetical protein
MRIAALLASLSLAIGAQAQTVVNADDAAFQPTLNRDEKGYSSCGVRVIAIVHGVKNEDTEVYDFSVNVYADNLVALMKAGKYLAPSDVKRGYNIEKRKIAMPVPTAFWIASRDQDGIAKMVKISPSEDKGFILGGSDFGQALEVIYATASAKPIQFSLEYPNNKFKRIVAFKAAENAENRAAVFACMDGFKARLQKEVDANPAK